MHSELKVGSKWSDNDPRLKGRRIVEVVCVGNVFATIRNTKSGRETTTAVERFGKKGRIGFTLVSRQGGTEK